MIGRCYKEGWILLHCLKSMVSVDDEVLPYKGLTVEYICGVIEDNEEVNEMKEEDLEIPSFSDAVKGLETFCCFIES